MKKLIVTFIFLHPSTYYFFLFRNKVFLHVVEFSRLNIMKKNEFNLVGSTIQKKICWLSHVDVGAPTRWRWPIKCWEITAVKCMSSGTTQTSMFNVYLVGSNLTIQTQWVGSLFIVHCSQLIKLERKIWRWTEVVYWCCLSKEPYCSVGSTNIVL